MFATYSVWRTNALKISFKMHWTRKAWLIPGTVTLTRIKIQERTSTDMFDSYKRQKPSAFRVGDSFAQRKPSLLQISFPAHTHTEGWLQSDRMLAKPFFVCVDVPFSHPESHSALCCHPQVFSVGDRGPWGSEVCRMLTTDCWQYIPKAQPNWYTVHT